MILVSLLDSASQGVVSASLCSALNTFVNTPYWPASLASFDCTTPCEIEGTGSTWAITSTELYETGASSHKTAHMASVYCTKAAFPKGPLEYIHMDILGPVTKLEQGNQFVFVMAERLYETEYVDTYGNKKGHQNNLYHS